MTKISNVSQIMRQQQDKLKYVYQQAFIGTFSHEQMTPLNSIINLASILIDKRIYANQQDEDFKLLKCIFNSANIMYIMNQTILECKNYEDKKLDIKMGTR